MWARKSMNQDDKEQGGWEKRVRQEGKGNNEAGEMAGEGGGSLCPFASLFSFQQPTSQRENHTPARSSSLIPPNGRGEFFSPNIDDGAVWYPHATPFRAYLPVSTMGAAWIPHATPISFHFKWGRHVGSRYPLFLSFRMGAV